MKPTRLELAKKLALEAGALALERAKGHLKIEFKDILQTDPVTNVDKECEAFIVREIQRYYPEDGIIGEEGGSYSKPASNFWVIDPLDGTQNYLHHLPLYCVSIAYVENDHPTIGVIFAPVFNELFVAEKGKGSTLNGRKIEVSDETHDFSRHLGTSALSIAWVSCGRLSFYKAHELFPWDFAAGTLIVEEAQGVASTLENTPLIFDQPQSFFASNNRIRTKHFETMK
ncbi:MAG: inositol monophosphatase family protein [Chlamydiia bacterium]